MSEINVLEHDDVPEHHLVEVKDEDKILTQYNVGKDQLPKIRKTDPCVKILEEIKDFEIEEGRLIRIVRPHSVSGVSVAYRVVVRG
ncbi:MAG: DNA-directed RNA polymerase subunit H [Thermoplasmata archaeon]|nr:DNA-directed RNA polymerase subunit H [Thermoplasmata archaeon]MCK5397076.1 DNA-directed RNA polymerase subunit H [Thermoplasmata archaeon]